MDQWTTTPRRTFALWRVVVVLVGAALAAGVLATPANAAPPDAADEVQVFTGDVFEIVGSTLRNPTAATDPSAQLFSVSGVALDLTWGEWSSASATSTVRSRGGPSPSTKVRVRLAGLVPGGVYSVFWGTLAPDSENPLCPGVERTLPLPSIDPDQAPDASSFVAYTDGTARFDGQLDMALLDATQVFFSVIYHFDGQTYGSLPNRGEWLTQGENCRSSFGDDAMRQLLILQQW